MCMIGTIAVSCMLGQDHCVPWYWHLHFFSFLQYSLYSRWGVVLVGTPTIFPLFPYMHELGPGEHYCPFNINCWYIRGSCAFSIRKVCHVLDPTHIGWSTLNVLTAFSGRLLVDMVDFWWLPYNIVLCSNSAMLTSICMKIWRMKEEHRCFTMVCKHRHATSTAEVITQQPWGGRLLVLTATCIKPVVKVNCSTDQYYCRASSAMKVEGIWRVSLVSKALLLTLAGIVGERREEELGTHCLHMH